MLCLQISRNNEPDGVSATLSFTKYDSYVTVLDGPLGLSEVQSLCVAGKRLADAVVSRRLGYVLGWREARLSHAFLILQWVWQDCCFPLSSQNPPNHGRFGYPWYILAAFFSQSIGKQPYFASQIWHENQKFQIFPLDTLVIMNMSHPDII